MVLGLVLGAVKEVVQGLVQGVVEDVLLEFDTNIGTWEGNRGVQGMVQWLVLCMVAMWGDIRFGMTGATLLATRSVRGAIHFFSRCLDFVSTLCKICQNKICLGTVHKCDETYKGKNLS